MFDPGSMLILFALALMMVSPIHATFARPRISIAQVTPMVRGSVPPSAPAADRGELVRLADDILASDPLIRTIAAIAEAYDQA